MKEFAAGVKAFFLQSDPTAQQIFVIINISGEIPLPDHSAVCCIISINLWLEDYSRVNRDNKSSLCSETDIFLV